MGPTVVPQVQLQVVENHAVVVWLPVLVLPPVMGVVPAVVRVVPAVPLPPLPLPAEPPGVSSPPEEQAVPRAKSAPNVPKDNKVVFRFIFSPMCSKALEPLPGKCLVRSRAPQKATG